VRELDAERQKRVEAEKQTRALRMLVARLKRQSAAKKTAALIAQHAVP
jgi:hypothetical protein